MGFIASAKCLVLGHIWEDWVYVRSNECSQQRVCSRCKGLEKQIAHQFPPWAYVSDGEGFILSDSSRDRCAMQRICQRCPERETKTEHQWSSWERSVDNLCELTRTCSRCHKHEAKTDHFNLGPEQYASPTSCDLMVKCFTCGTWVHTGTEHEKYSWHYLYEGSCASAFRCTRCRDVKHYDIRHKPRIYQPSDNNPCRSYAVCPRCDDRDFRDYKVEHDPDPSDMFNRCRRCGAVVRREPKE
jgi:hypothetical protein